VTAARRVLSVRTRNFLSLFNSLPEPVQRAAKQRYLAYFVSDPYHSLLERHDLYDVADSRPNSFAVTIMYGYRAVGFFDDAENRYVWYWCGSHADYDQRFRPGR